MTVRELIEKLSRLDQDATVYQAALLKDRTTLALLPVVATAEKEGKILLCDPDVARALLVLKQGLN